MLPAMILTRFDNERNNLNVSIFDSNKLIEAFDKTGFIKVRINGNRNA